MDSLEIGCLSINEKFRMKKVALSLVAAALITAPAFASAATEVNFGGDIIIRPFYRDNQNGFNNDAVDAKSFVTERARLKANIKVDENVGGVVEILHFRRWGASDPNRIVDANNPTVVTSAVLDDNWMDLNQAYINVDKLFDTSWSMRAGRQEMAYGDQRLVGNTNFWSTYPFPRAYDALKFSTNNETYSLDAWSSKVASRKIAPLTGSTPTTDTGDRNFHGIWGTLKNILPDNNLDLYLLNMTESGYRTGTATTAVAGDCYGASGTLNVCTVPPNFGQFPYATNAGTLANGRASVYNAGTRIKGKAITNLDYTVELNQQFGKFADGGRINAFGGAAVVGYTIPEAMGLRVSGEYVYASGDDTPTSGDHKTFYQFSPSPHMHLGAQDLIAFQNIVAMRLGASFKAKENLKISADFWNFKLDKANDLWYSSNATTTRFASTGVANPLLARGGEGLLTDRNIGNEFDLVANYSYTQALSFEFGGSVFNPGSGITGSANTAATAGVVGGQPSGLVGHTIGKGDSAKFVWGMLMLKF